MREAIPLFDCRLDVSALSILEPVFASGALAAGTSIGELEARLEALHPGRFAVALSDMTQALGLALRLGGIGPGDEVLTLALNCMSSNSAITLVGARPVWVDVDPDTMTIDLADCARALTPRTRALVVYHVAGYPADIAAIEAFCQSHDLILIEDANNALGARSAGRAIGNAGRFSVFSFYANRQVNAIEGAALLCADRDSAERARRLRRFGVDVSTFRDEDGEIAVGTDVSEIGWPAAMSNVHARLACFQLDRVDRRLERTRQHAEMLRAGLAGTRVVPIAWRSQDEPAFWCLLVRSERRDKLMRLLKAQGVQCSKLHQRNDRYTGFAATPRLLPGTDLIDREMLALPVGWWLDPTQVTTMIRLVRDSSTALDSGQGLGAGTKDRQSS
jgi:dTDP-4-amino-4,6-dideoxygalactose transaminase